MKSKLVAAAIGASIMAGSTLALADEWKTGRSSGHGHHDRGKSDYGRHDRDDRGHHRGHQHHHKSSWHHHYHSHHYVYYPHYYGCREPHAYERDGLTIIFRGSFY